MQKPIITITIESDLLKRIDEKRGDIPRSLFIQRLIEKGMK
jgi:metal-responsive CopG/Arc/MetJ family transcriptional regulator